MEKEQSGNAELTSLFNTLNPYHDGSVDTSNDH